MYFRKFSCTCFCVCVHLSRGLAEFFSQPKRPCLFLIEIRGGKHITAPELFIRLQIDALFTVYVCNCIFRAKTWDGNNNYYYIYHHTMLLFVCHVYTHQNENEQWQWNVKRQPKWTTSFASFCRHTMWLLNFWPRDLLNDGIDFNGITKFDISTTRRLNYFANVSH